MKSYLVTAFALLITFILCAFLGSIAIRNNISADKEQMERLILEHSYRLNEVISRQLYKTQALAALVITGDGEVHDFHKTAAVIAAEVPALANVLLAPDGVVTDVYPFEGNEAVIGLDFFREQDHVGNREAMLARETGELVMAGPFMLRQGIMGLTGRYPVYIDADTEENKFWGLVSVSLKFPDALDDAGFSMLEFQDLSYELWRTNPDTLERQVIATNHEHADYRGAYIERAVNIHHAEWYFRIFPIRPWYGYAETWLIFFGALSISLFVAFVMKIYIDAMYRATKVQETTQAKSKFLAYMSHEMRSPMNAIIGISDIELEKDTHSPDALDAFGRINNSGRTLLEIINNILDLSKVETGKLEIVPVQYDVPGLINDTARLNVMLIRGKPIKFVVKAAETLPSALFGDDLRIKQILNNILSNSIKYTSEGTVTFGIDSEVCEDGITLVFSIKDTGQGMTKEQLVTLYDEYLMFNQEANRTKQGSGLGLSITKSLVELMNGRIEVESEPGVGSTFTVYLLQQPADDTPLGKELAEELSSFKAIYRTNMVKQERAYMPYGNVLAVDDVDANLFVTCELMRPYGIAFDTAVSGYEALEKIRAGKTYDIIFMDHMMPGMDGIETTKILRAEGYKLPVVALTANAVAGMEETFLANGFDAFVSKPIDMSLFDHVLNTYIRDKQPPEVIEEARRQQETMQAAASQAAVSQDVASQDESNVSLISLLKEIPGLDVDSALDAMDGMESVYLGVIKITARLLTERMDKMDKLIDSDLQSFRVEAHGLKSVLKNIGSEILSNRALHLEDAALKNDSPYCQEHYPAFRAGLAELSDHLNEALQTETACARETADKSALTKIIAKAKIAVEKYNSIFALELLTPTMSFTYNAETDELLEKIILSLEASDYEEAAAHIMKMEGILNE